MIIYDIRGAIRNTRHGSANFAGDSNDARPKLVRVCTIKTWPIMYFLRSHAYDLYLYIILFLEGIFDSRDEVNIPPDTLLEL